MSDPRYWTPGMAAGWRIYAFFCCVILVFLLVPLLVVIPLSFNAKPYFTLTPEMLRLDPAGFSRQWYAEVLGSRVWRSAFGNSLNIALWATLIAVILGTSAALGLERAKFRGKNLVYALL